MVSLPAFITLAATVTLALLARLAQGSWFAPGPFFALFWSFALGLPLLLAPDFRISAVAISVILSFVLTVCLATQFGTWWRDAGIGARESPARSSVPSSRFLTALLLVASCLSLLASVEHMRATSGDLRSAVHIEAWQDLAREISIRRYSGGEGVPIRVRILSVGTYFGALLGGLLFLRRGVVRKAIALLPLGTALVYVLLTTAKTAFLYALVLWLSTHFAAGAWLREQKLRLFTTRNVLAVLVAVPAVVVFFVVTFLLRYGMRDLERLDIVFDRLKNTAFGHLSAFSAWIDGGGLRATCTPTFGQYTFPGPFDLLGIARREPGIYTDVMYGHYELKTNVYTLFRGLISDFTYPGALIVVAVASFVSGVAYQTLRSGKGGAVGVSMLGLFYSVTLWSHVADILAYNTIILAWFCFSFCLLVEVRNAPRTHLFRSVRPFRSASE